MEKEYETSVDKETGEITTEEREIREKRFFMDTETCEYTIEDVETGEVIDSGNI